MSADRDSAPDLAPPVPHQASPEELLRMWVDVMNASEQFLLAGLRHEIGPDGDLQAAHRQWYQERMEEHTQDLIHFTEEYQRRTRGRG